MRPLESLVTATLSIAVRDGERRACQCAPPLVERFPLAHRERLELEAGPGWPV